MTLTIPELYEIMGVPLIETISTAFYERVYHDDEDTEFRDMFRNSNTQVAATHLLTSYLVQKFGGPRLWGGMQFDTQYVKDVHKHFPVTEAGGRRWIFHFMETLKTVELGPRSDEIKETLNNWLSLFAKSIINKH